MGMEIYEAIANRRSAYEISKESVATDERIQEIIRYAVKHTPSAFNSQTGRAVLLLRNHHDRLWDITRKALKAIVPAESFAATEQKINSFRNGYGSVLFFEDQKIVEGFQESFPSYKDNFPVWSQHASGILQYITWTLLEAEGFGASLQHYNPLIDHEVREEWGIPQSWKLIAQMPFGKPAAPAGEKEFSPLEERVKVFG